MADHYQVESGDTLGKIASATEGVSSSDLAKANPWIDDPNLIRPGWVIHIPAAAEVEPEPPVEPPDPPIEPPASSNVYGPGTHVALPVPAGAIQVTPQTIRAAIQDNPAGTNYELLPGRWRGIEGLPNKVNNGYYGDPTNHEAVVLDGEAEYASLDNGAQPTGGLQWIMRVLSGNVLANMTVEGYRGNQDKFAPFRMSGSSGVLTQNVEFRHNFAHGINASGPDHKFIGVSSWGNGSMSLKGRDLHNGVFDRCDFHSSGDDNMKAMGRTPKISVSDRGICKITSSNGVLLKNSHIHDIKGFSNGWWADGNCNDFDVQDSLFENMSRFGIQHELTHGGRITGSKFVACGDIEDSRYKYSHAAIGMSIGGVVIMEGNEIDGGPNKKTWNGIMVYAPNPASRPYDVPDDVWSASCGTVIRNNKVRNIRGYNVASHCNVTRDGCNFHDHPEQLTIESNDYDPGVGFWERGAKTAAEWAAYGYS